MSGSLDLVLLGLAGMGAGLVNALAGGGTLITFPALVAAGIPPVAANLTSTVSLAPGYLGATLAQAKDLTGQRGRLLATLPAGILGGLAGSFLLLRTDDRMFRAIVPFLILLACLLLALQERVRSWLAQRAGASPAFAASAWVALPVGLAAVYGGYFGAGLSVIVLAVLGLAWEDTLTRLNALKQAVAFGVNVTAALFFVFSGRVVWPAAAATAAGAVVGGALGGKLARTVRPATLRWTVVGIGVVIAVTYWIR